MPRDQPYILLHVANLVGLFTCIFIKASERNSIRNVCASTVKRGLGGLHGNKVWTLQLIPYHMLTPLN
jgi:hypothetical protein